MGGRAGMERVRPFKYYVMYDIIFSNRVEEYANQAKVRTCKKYLSG
jgi:hypothetical protein